MGRRLLKVTGPVLILIIGALYIVLFKPSLLMGGVESNIEGRLQGIIGPAGSYKVKLNAPLLHMARGNMGDVSIKGDHVRLNNGIVAERLDISLHNVKADVPTRKITKIGSDTFSVTINQFDLDRYIAAELPEIPDLSVELQNGKVAVSTKNEVALINSRIMFDGTIDIADGDKLILKLHDVKAGRTRIPGSIRKKLEEKVNPILDTTGWNVGMELMNVDIRDGKIEVSGKVDPKDLASFQSHFTR